MDDIAKLLIEKRKVEANKKEITKKAYTIIKAYGKPIVSQEFNSTLDYWSFDDISNPKIYDEGDYYTQKLGYYFDALRFKTNMYIKLLFQEDKPSYLEIQYEGDIVYSETEGHITGYAPKDEWEKPFNKIYNYARPLEVNKTLEEEELRKENQKQKNSSILNKFKKMWGL